jgi:hypothetical protein
VLAVGEDALVLSTGFCGRCQSTSAYLLRRGSTVATPLGAAMEIVPSRDGRGLWMLERRRAGRCTLREGGLDGGHAAAPSRVSCRTDMVAELPAGLLVSSTGPYGTNEHNALLSSDGSSVALDYQRAEPVVGNLVLTGVDRRTPLLLHDAGTGASHRLRWPSRPGYSLSSVTGQPDGTFAIVAFAKYSPSHRLDLWLLDVRARRWQHLPGMPAHVVPKATDVEWTADGQVVVLSSTMLAVWRPGEPRLALRRMKPPKQPGIDFVSW